MEVDIGSLFYHNDRIYLNFAIRFENKALRWSLLIIPFDLISTI